MPDTPTTPGLPLYAIRPLRWEAEERRCGGTRYAAATIFGDLVVLAPSEGLCEWRDAGAKWRLCNGADAGKAAAESYYRSRLLPALEERGPG